MKNTTVFFAMGLLAVNVPDIIVANPTLTPGVWKNITPAALDPTQTYGIDFVQIDPSAPSTLYS